MIIHPKNWSTVGQPIQINDIEEEILQTLVDINCSRLSFSGGLDSSLMLSYMVHVFDKVIAYTIGFPENHPDIEYSRLVAKEFRKVEHVVYVPTADEVAKELSSKSGPDVGVRLFYKFLAKQRISSIVACDGIDEFMCGYYDHQQHPDEETYYKYIRHLQDEQLKPLDKNSGRIKVYLPYLDERVVYLLSQIPLSDKVDKENRKKIMVNLAADRVHEKVVTRWKYGFCDALGFKKVRYENRA